MRAALFPTRNMLVTHRFPRRGKWKTDGAKLTGMMPGDQFEPSIQNGEIRGGDISFTVHREFGNGIDLKYTGKVTAEKILFKVQRSGDDTAQEFVAARKTE